MAVQTQHSCLPAAISKRPAGGAPAISREAIPAATRRLASRPVLRLLATCLLYAWDAHAPSSALFCREAFWARSAGEVREWIAAAESGDGGGGALDLACEWWQGLADAEIDGFAAWLAPAAVAQRCGFGSGPSLSAERRDLLWLPPGECRIS